MSTTATVDARTEATRSRIRGAALRCIERWGLTKTSLEDVAGEAGLSRATVYRHFPGGRDQLVRETVTWEVGNFLGKINEAVSADHGLEAKLVHGLLVGRDALAHHRLLHRILSTDREALLAELAELAPLMLAAVQGELAAVLATERLRPGVDIDQAAGYLARLFASYLGTSGGQDLTDPAVVRDLVRTFFVAGILEAG